MGIDWSVAGPTNRGAEEIGEVVGRGNQNWERECRRLVLC